MIKKYYLSVMITALTISPACIQALDYEGLLRQLKIDGIYYTIETLNIVTLNNQNNLQIKSSALASLIKNIYFSIVDFSLSAEAIKLSQQGKISNSDLISYLLTNLYCGIENVKFSFYDLNRFRKSNQLDLGKKKVIISTNQKRKQALWLAINIFLPYLTLAIKRLAWDESDIKHSLYCDSNESQKTINASYKFFMISHVLTLFSENLRRSLFYKQISLEKKDEKNITA